MAPLRNDKGPGAAPERPPDAPRSGAEAKGDEALASEPTLATDATLVSDEELGRLSGRAAKGQSPPALVSPPPRSPGSPDRAALESARTSAQPLSGRAAGVATFYPGDVVAGRYRVTRFVAQGGMGEVYEVEDQELRERVALKTIRGEIAEDNRMIDRFRREILLARRVTHPNVCRIFDVGTHEAPPPAGVTPGTRIRFLTMELLHGETLARRLKRAGRMSCAEATPIVIGMAQGLHAAHKAGVVHRDFKSENVMLVPQDGVEGGVRAVVTDFGLARGGTGEAAAQTLTGTGGLVGTPGYMSPEQVEGGEVGPAADIYALGVVMYEMVTGVWPFRGETPLSTAVKRLKEAPAPPRTMAPGIEPDFETAVLRGPERDPADRFGRAVDVVRALAGEDVPGGQGERSRAQQRIVLRRARRRLAVGALALVLALGGLAGARIWRRHHGVTGGGGDRTAPVGGRRSIAVLGFRNVSGKPEAGWIGGALAEMLTSELGAGGRLRTIADENIARALTEAGVKQPDGLSADTLGKLRSNLGADLFVSGSYLALGERLRLDLRIQDSTQHGEIIDSLSEEGRLGELLELVTRTGERLRQRLGVGALTTAEAGSLKAGLPSATEVQRLYAEGRERIRAYDGIGARERLERAVAAEPEQPLLHAALGDAWTLLGYEMKAREESKRAFELAGGLSREQQLLLEGAYRNRSNDSAKAVEVYKTLYTFFPDNVRYGTQLANALVGAFRAPEALAILAELRKHVLAEGGDELRLDMLEAHAAEAVGDFRREQEIAARVAVRADAAGSNQIAARARIYQGVALLSLGEPQKALAVLTAAKQAATRSGEPITIARSLNVLGSVYLQKGDLPAGKAVCQEALAICRSIGNKNVAVVALNNIGAAQAGAGDLAGARRSFEEALAIDREIVDRRGVVLELHNIANVVGQDGDLEGSRKNFEEALALARELHDRAQTASALFGLGETLQGQGDLAGARRRHEEALAIRTTLGQKSQVAMSQMALVALSTEEGRPKEGVALGEKALAEFRIEQDGNNQAMTASFLARAQQVLGHGAEAQRSIAEARALASHTSRPEVRLTVELGAVRVDLLAGRRAEAERVAQTVLDEAQKAHLYSHILDARLLLGECELRGGRAAAGRARLAELEKEARQKGFGLVARQAAQATRRGR